MAVTAVIGLAGAGYQIYKGEQQKKKAAELAAQAGERPDYKTPQGEYDNLALLQSRASQGLSDSTLTALNSGNERAFSSAVNNVLMGGGTQNNVAGLYDSFNNSMNKVALADDARKVQNLNNYIQQQSRMSGFADKNFQLNELDPWKDNRAAANRLSEQGNNMTNAGIGTAISTGIGAAGQLGRQSQLGGNGQQGATPYGTQPGVTEYSQPIGPMPEDNQTNIYLAGMDMSTVNPETLDAVQQLLQPNYNQTSFY